MFYGDHGRPMPDSDALTSIQVHESTRRVLELYKKPGSDLRGRHRGLRRTVSPGVLSQGNGASPERLSPSESSSKYGDDSRHAERNRDEGYGPGGQGRRSSNSCPNRSGHSSRLLWTGSKEQDCFRFRGSISSPFEGRDPCIDLL